MLEMHNFFTKESSSYMQGCKTFKEYYLYYPIAYCKFMYASLKYLYKK